MKIEIIKNGITLQEVWGGEDYTAILPCFLTGLLGYPTRVCLRGPDRNVEEIIKRLDWTEGDEYRVIPCKDCGTKRHSVPGLPSLCHSRWHDIDIQSYGRSLGKNLSRDS